MSEFRFCSYLILFFILPITLSAQNPLQKTGDTKPPKLVVGIVIDQMRYDYLHRFYDKYSDKGFKRLMSEGFVFKNGHFNYIPTNTAPGHAAIYTGSTPAYHGIVDNNFYNREIGRKFYCVEDTSVRGVGSDSKAGQMSPKNLKASTFTDELRLATMKQAKVIGISIKDRGAVLPAGHLPTAAYWYDEDSGTMITSDFYMKKLPDWVATFNAAKPVERLLSEPWHTLLPIETYIESRKDMNDYERKLGNSDPTFPYDFSDAASALQRNAVIRYMPAGNTMITEFAQAAIKSEGLGKDNITDVLAVSYSATDIAGHAFGPWSKELQDIYLRMDLEIANLLATLDEEVGKGEYTIFLTADHAASLIPLYLREEGFNTAYAPTLSCKQDLENYLTQIYGEGKWIDYVASSQIYLNHSLIHKNKINLDEIRKKTADFVLACEGFYQVYSASDVPFLSAIDGQNIMLQRGLNQKLGGDVVFILEPGWISGGYGSQGTTHGSGYAYDTHVPIIFYGKHIPKGSSVRRISITDIAPTISTMLNLQLPSACTGNPISEILE
ncbi:MAG: alkaline phosphatase family protein [Bernardetiaceae bacterium]|nr:alkaline phosphatase family protein [Bernardetiaceae bacterium]